MPKLHLERGIPHPTDLTPERASTLRENMQVAANTAEVLRQLGADFGDDPEDQATADQVFADFTARAKQQFEQATQSKVGATSRRAKPKIREPDAPAMYSGGVAHRIGLMLKEYNNPIVADAAELRLVVTNKLLDLTSCGDPRIEIKAAEMLGKISDVGLFAEKTEISITYNSVSDLDKAIKDKVRNMLSAHGADVTTLDFDLDKELGITPKIEMVEEVILEDVGKDATT